jgi:hypothetical protein
MSYSSPSANFSIIIAHDMTNGKSKQFLIAIKGYQHQTFYLQHHGAIYHIKNFQINCLNNGT